MDAIFILIFAAVQLIFEVICWLLFGIVAHLLAAVEAVYILAIRGREPAVAKFKQRSASIFEFFGLKEKPQSTKYPDVHASGKVVAVAVGIAVVMIAVVITPLVVHHHITAQRIARTKVQVEQLAEDFEAQAEAPNATPLQSMALPDVDAWSRPIELVVTTSLLGTSIKVQSAGPDRLSQSADDISERRFVRAKAGEVGRELVDRGKDAVRNRSSRLFGKKSDKPDDDVQAVD